jgi:hypothetical protein
MRLLSRNDRTTPICNRLKSWEHHAPPVVGPGGHSPFNAARGEISILRAAVQSVTISKIRPAFYAFIGRRHVTECSCITVLYGQTKAQSKEEQEENISMSRMPLVQSVTRQVEGVTIVDLTGRITLGEATLWCVTSSTTSWVKAIRKSC